MTEPELTPAQRKVLENKLRHWAKHQGLRLKKSGRRDRRALDYGGYWLLGPNNAIVVGGDNGTTIDMIQTALEDPS